MPQIEDKPEKKPKSLKEMESLLAECERCLLWLKGEIIHGNPNHLRFIEGILARLN